MQTKDWSSARGVSIYHRFHRAGRCACDIRTTWFSCNFFFLCSSVDAQLSLQSFQPIFDEIDAFGVYSSWHELWQSVTLLLCSFNVAAVLSYYLWALTILAICSSELFVLFLTQGCFVNQPHWLDALCGSLMVFKHVRRNLESPESHSNAFHLFVGCSFEVIAA